MKKVLIYVIFILISSLVMGAVESSSRSEPFIRWFTSSAIFFLSISFPLVLVALGIKEIYGGRKNE